MKRYYNQFSPWDIKGISDSYKHIYENWVEDLEDMGIDQLISDYLGNNQPENKIISRLWVTSDSRVGIRFIPGESDVIRFADSEEVMQACYDFNDIFLDLTDLENFYKSHGYNPKDIETGVFFWG